MDLSSTQQSPSIFSLEVPIGTPIEPIGPSSLQSLSYPVLWFSSCFTQILLYGGPCTTRFFKIYIDFWTRGIRPCLMHFKKKKNHHHHLFIKNHDFQKNHASISKLGAFSHASSILKKEIIFPPNINVFKSHASIYKLGAFGHASFIFKKGDHHRHLFIKK